MKPNHMLMAGAVLLFLLTKRKKPEVQPAAQPVAPSLPPHAEPLEAVSFDAADDDEEQEEDDEEEPPPIRSMKPVEDNRWDWW